MRFRNYLFATLIIVSATALSYAQSSPLKRGDALVAQGNYKAAIQEYEKISSGAGESYARASYNIGVCYYELWRPDVAIGFYKRAIELKEGNYPRASYALGVAYEDQGKLAEAKQAYEQSIRASRNDFASAIYKLGVLEAKSGEFKKAASLFRDAAARDGQHRAASHNNLGVMLAQFGLLQEAETQFVMALKQSDGSLSDAAHNLKLCRSLMTTAQSLVPFVLL
ncbi:MAG TPA: tetratricopeptide repeat protein [Pyrinomonadaceae bacterium]|nr:tetratricopeptide repeat protein [Pyrinomonadaceae bacterium]